MKSRQLLGERIRPQPQLAVCEPYSCPQLVAALADAYRDVPIADEADRGASRYSRSHPALGSRARIVSNFCAQPVHVVDVVVSRSLYAAFSLWPLPRVKYAAAG